MKTVDRSTNRNINKHALLIILTYMPNYVRLKLVPLFLTASCMVRPERSVQRVRAFQRWQLALYVGPYDNSDHTVCPGNGTKA